MTVDAYIVLWIWCATVSVAFAASIMVLYRR